MAEFDILKQLEGLADIDGVDRVRLGTESQEVGEPSLLGRVRGRLAFIGRFFGGLGLKVQPNEDMDPYVVDLVTADGTELVCIEEDQDDPDCFTVYEITWVPGNRNEPPTRFDSERAFSTNLDSALEAALNLAVQMALEEYQRTEFENIV